MRDGKWYTATSQMAERNLTESELQLCACDRANVKADAPPVSVHGYGLQRFDVTSIARDSDNLRMAWQP
jgi:hypothetical protein